MVVRSWPMGRMDLGRVYTKQRVTDIQVNESPFCQILWNFGANTWFQTLNSHFRVFVTSLYVFACAMMSVINFIEI